MTHRYRRFARRVGIASSLKELRHYSATQLLAAGTDLNTVAGRLGHAEGSTTLKFYAQFTRPADQRAAAIIPSQLDRTPPKGTGPRLTVSTYRFPAPTGLLPSLRSWLQRLGSTNLPLFRGLRSSHLRLRTNKGHQNVTACVKTRSGGLPQLDPIALGIGDPAEPADTLHVLRLLATSAPLACDCASIASRLPTRKLTMVCWARDPK